MTQSRRPLFIHFRTSALLAALLAGSGGWPAGALTWRSGDVVQVGRSEVIRDDLFVGGRAVQIDGTVTGDLLAAGGRVTVTGRVGGNLWAAGQQVTLSGRVERSARLSGATLDVTGPARIGGDLLAGGATLNVGPQVSVGRDVAFAGSQLRLAGTVARDAYVAASAVEVLGVIGRQARFTIDPRVAAPASGWFGAAAPLAVSPGLRFGPDGRVRGALQVQMPEQPTVPAGAVAGTVEFTPLSAAAPASPAARPSAWRPVQGFLSLFVSIFLAGALLVGLRRGLLGGAARVLRTTPGASLLAGTLGVLGLPVAALAGIALLVAAGATLATLGLAGIGLPVALIAAPTLLALAALTGWLGLIAAQGLVAYQLGRWTLRTLSPGSGTPGTDTPRTDTPGTGTPRTDAPGIWPTLLVGSLGLALAESLPVLGPFVGLAALLLGVGAVWRWWRGPGPTPVPAAPAAQVHPV